MIGHMAVDAVHGYTHAYTEVAHEAAKRGSVSKERKADEDRWVWWIIVFPCIFVGVIVGGVNAGIIGGAIGLGLVAVYAIIDWCRYRARKARRLAEQAKAIAEEKAATEAREAERNGEPDLPTHTRL